MGHIRLGVLPKSRRWQQVVDELRVGAGVGEIAALVAEAAESSLKVGGVGTFADSGEYQYCPDLLEGHRWRA
jgi:hypothetical protein